MNNKRFSIKLYPRTDKINSQNLTPIYARIVSDKKMELSTSKFINPSDWNNKKQRLNPNSPNGETLNTYFDSFITKILQAHTKLFVEGKPFTSDILKENIFGKAEKEKTLMDTVNEHNEKFEKRIGIDYSNGSFKNYKTTKKYLEEFLQHQYQKKDIPISFVKYAFCEHYFTYLTTNKSCNINGANKHIQRLKKLINYAYKMGYIQSNNILSYSLKFTPFHQHKLTWEEIERLQNLNLYNQSLIKVLDIFLFQCFTGLAYSDVKALSNINLIKGTDKNTWISMQRTKTKREFFVPLLQPAKDILNKYLVAEVKQFTSEEERKKQIFPVLSNQKMNDALKIIGEIAGINKSISTHVARHTFATTVTLQEGVPMETVSKLLGHSKISTTQIYSVVTQLKISKDMQGVIDKLA